MVCLEGKACYRVPECHGSCEVSLDCNQALFLAADTWVANRPQVPYRSFGVIFYPQATRFYEVAYDATFAGSSPGALDLMRRNMTWPVPVDSAGRSLLHCLLASGSAPETGRYRTHLADLLLLKARETLDLEPETPSGKAWQTYQTLCQCLEVHAQEPLTREGLARLVNVHPNHVSRLFAQFSGKTFVQHLREVRLTLARKMLRSSTCTMGEIAANCGFGSASVFIRVFRDAHGVSPGRWRLG